MKAQMSGRGGGHLEQAFVESPSDGGPFLGRDHPEDVIAGSQTPGLKIITFASRAH